MARREQAGVPGRGKEAALRTAQGLTVHIGRGGGYVNPISGKVLRMRKKSVELSTYDGQTE
jgi:hypothetical protein